MPSGSSIRVFATVGVFTLVFSLVVRRVDGNSGREVDGDSKREVGGLLVDGVAAGCTPLLRGLIVAIER
jgi:hypothetical protein